MATYSASGRKPTRPVNRDAPVKKPKAFKPVTTASTTAAARNRNLMQKKMKAMPTGIGAGKSNMSPATMQNLLASRPNRPKLGVPSRSGTTRPKGRRLLRG